MSTPKKSDPNKKTYWFLLSFLVPVPGQWRPVSFVGSYSKKTTTLPVLQAMRQANGLPDEAVLMQVSYLGYFSKHEMQGTSDAPVSSVMSTEYRQGLTVGLNPKPSLDNPPVNPYTHMGESVPDAAFKAAEWDYGYRAGQELLGTTQVLYPERGAETTA